MMRRNSVSVKTFLTTLAALGCLMAYQGEGFAQAAPACADFDDLVLGATYIPTDVFITQGVMVTAADFTFTSGSTTSGGVATVENGLMAVGSGQEMNLNNILLKFDWGQTVACASFRFGEFGGNLNIEINGVFVNFQNFIDINGATIGGVAVTVVGGGLGNDAGQVFLNGNIVTLSIGGQELWIDDVCPDCGQPPEQNDCATFDDLTPGNHYFANQGDVTNGVQFLAKDFFDSQGNLVMGGVAIVGNAGFAPGSGNEMNLDNIALEFFFNYPIDCLSFVFGEYGGNLNIRINGEFRNFDDFNDINNQIIGGVLVAVVNGFGNDKGRVNLYGTVHEFCIGGQELWIDDVCPTCDCPPDFETYAVNFTAQLFFPGASPKGVPVDFTSFSVQGPVAIQRTAGGTDAAGDQVIETEILSMDLTGQALIPDGGAGHIANVRLTISPDRSSTGEVRGQSSGNQYPADSFFDIFTEISLEGTWSGGSYNQSYDVSKAPRLKTAPTDPVTGPHGLNNTFTYSGPDIQLVPLPGGGGTPPPTLTPPPILQCDFFDLIQLPTFSVAPGGPSGLDPSDLFAPGPALLIPGLNLGLAMGDDVDALSYGLDVLTACPQLVFSVDTPAVGTTGSAVEFEQTVGTGTFGPPAPPEAAGDEFLRPFPGVNTLLLDEELLGLLALGVASPADTDDLDALDNHPPTFADIDNDKIPDRDVFFSLSVGSATLGSSLTNLRPGAPDTAAGADDILVFCPPVGLALYASGKFDIGLSEQGDDIDAMCLMDVHASSNVLVSRLDPGFGSLFPSPGLASNDYAIFSLAPGSPSLFGPDGAPGVAGVDDDSAGGIDDIGESYLFGDDFHPGDLFITDFSGAFALFMPYADLGLLKLDNLNALKCLKPIVVLDVTTDPVLGAAGGAVEIHVDTALISVATQSGDAHDLIAAALADAINADPDMKSLDVKASSHLSNARGFVESFLVLCGVGNTNLLAESNDARVMFQEWPIPMVPTIVNTVWVDYGYSGTEVGTEDEPFSTLAAAMAAVEIVPSGAVVKFKTSAGNETGVFNNRARLQLGEGQTGPVRIGP